MPIKQRRKPNPLLKDLEAVPKQSEADLVSACVAYARLCGFMCIRNNVGLNIQGVGTIVANQNKGIPDYLFVKDGRAFWVEFKASTKRTIGKPTDARGLPNSIAFQRSWLLKLRDAGCIADFCNSFEYFKDLVDIFERGTRGDVATILSRDATLKPMWEHSYIDLHRRNCAKNGQEML